MERKKSIIEIIKGDNDGVWTEKFEDSPDGEGLRNLEEYISIYAGLSRSREDLVSEGVYDFEELFYSALLRVGQYISNGVSSTLTQKGICLDNVLLDLEGLNIEPPRKYKDDR